MSFTRVKMPLKATSLFFVMGMVALLIGLAVAPADDTLAGGLSQPVTRIRLVEMAVGFSNVTDIEPARDSGDGRIFVTQKAGKIMIISSDGSINPTPLLDISSSVTVGEEQGLVSMALHPQFDSTGYFYVNYTDLSGTAVTSRFEISAANPDLADPSSELILLSIPQPSPTHNGAELLFGPDGYLYIGQGDGGPFADPAGNGQNPATLSGAILRVDVDGGTPYAIPADNPFVGLPDRAPEIWAMGLRNPWRFSFDRQSGELYIADVGGGAWEELDVEPPGHTGGSNYGWRCYEGFAPYILAGCPDASAMTFPVIAISHDSACAIVGGYVYRGGDYPDLYGRYLFADFCSGTIWSIFQDGSGWNLMSPGRLRSGWLSTFGEGPDGTLYAANASTVYTITAESLLLSIKSYLPDMSG